MECSSTKSLVGGLLQAAHLPGLLLGEVVLGAKMLTHLAQNGSPQVLLAFVAICLEAVCRNPATKVLTVSALASLSLEGGVKSAFKSADASRS